MNGGKYVTLPPVSPPRASISSSDIARGSRAGRRPAFLAMAEYPFLLGKTGALPVCD